VVLAGNEVAQAMGSFGKKLEAEGEQLLVTEGNQQLSQADITAQVKLNALEIELSKEDGLVAMSKYQARADEIFADTSKGLNEKAGPAFVTRFNSLQAKSQIAVRATATLRAKKEQHGAALVQLDQLEKGVLVTHAGASTKVTNQIALSTGIGIINDLVEGRVIDAAQAAKARLKFTKGVALQSVTRWLNNQTQSTLMGAFKEMDTGKIKDPEVKKMWGLLDPTKKATLTAKAITNLKNALAFEDKVAKREIEALEAAAKKLMIDFYLDKDQAGKKVTKDRRGEIMSLLATNGTVPIATFKSMLADAAGTTSRFDDPRAITALKIKIMQTPHLVTAAEVINLRSSKTDELLSLLERKVEGRLAKARAIINADDAFIPSNIAEARIHKDAFNDKQAEIWETVLAEELAARDAGKTFDPVARAQQMIMDFENKKDQGEKVDFALGEMSSRGITDADSLENYITGRIRDRAPVTEIAILRRWFRESKLGKKK
tara:strand:+ start:5949 stop:7415 length:1467 start_codon:yes stop_codon:yes gene_type:complete